MTVDEHARRYPHVWRRFSPRATVVRLAWMVGIVALATWSVSNLDIPWEYFLDAHTQIADLLVRMFPPDWDSADGVVRPLLETIHIATLGTIATLFVAVPTAFLAARNTTPNVVAWALARFVLVASRSVNTVVWALIFVAVFGPGPMAGIWAIAARSIGFMGKLLAEAIEEVDPGPVEAIEATGASRLKVLLVAVVPQVMPVFVGTLVYRWDINIRESTVLGFVGAGGIGIALYAAINMFAWNEVSVMLIAVFAVVVVSEFVSATVRRRIT